MSQSLRLNLFSLLRILNHQKKLSIKRGINPDSKRIGQLIIILVAIILLGEFIFIGSVLGVTFSSSTSLEPYYIMNRILILVLLLNWGARFFVQKLPTQEMLPYATLPIKRNQLMDCLLIRSGAFYMNWFYLSYMIPFALIAVMPNWGILGVARYILGLGLLYIANGYWYTLCRTLIREHIAWVLLPIAVYGGIIAAEFTFSEYTLSYATMYLGQGFIAGWSWSYLLALALIAILYLINRNITQRISLEEVGHTDGKEEKVATTKEISFFNRFGEIGLWMQLEYKLLTRNKVPRTNSIRIIGLGLLLVCMILFEDNPIGIYSTHSLFGWLMIAQFLGGGMYIFLTNVMSFEGNYMDGLMAKRESVYNLLLTKYYLSAAFSVISFIALTMLVYKEYIQFWQLVSMTLFYSAVPSMCNIQNAIFNRNTLPLNARIATNGKARINIGQMVYNMTVVPITVIGPYLAYTHGSIWITNILLASLGSLSLVCAPIWLKWTYSKFLKNKYTNLEGFRVSR